MRFYSWRGAVLKSKLSPTTKLVLLTLGCHMNDMGESCFPSIDTLCKESSLSRPAVIKHIKVARQAGWIRVGNHGLGGQKWSRSEYSISLPDDYVDEKKAVKEVNCLDGKEAVKEVNCLNEKAVNEVSKGGKPDTEKAVNEVNPSSSVNKSNNYTRNSLREADGLNGEAALDLLNQFGVSDEQAFAYLLVCEKKRFAVGLPALELIQREAEIAQFSFAEAIGVCIAEGWVGFKAHWPRGGAPPGAASDGLPGEEAICEMGSVAGLKHRDDESLVDFYRRVSFVTAARKYRARPGGGG